MLGVDNGLCATTIRHFEEDMQWSRNNELCSLSRFRALHYLVILTLTTVRTMLYYLYRVYQHRDHQLCSSFSLRTSPSSSPRFSSQKAGTTSTSVVSKALPRKLLSPLV